MQVAHLHVRTFWAFVKHKFLVVSDSFRPLFDFVSLGFVVSKVMLICERVQRRGDTYPPESRLLRRWIKNLIWPKNLGGF